MYNLLVRLHRLQRLELLLPILALAARIVPGPRTIDDAYITFRYVQNLLSGHGLVYNPGQSVLGITTPIYSILMAALGGVFGGSQAPFPSIALAFNAVADAATCALLPLIAARLGSRKAGIAAALIWAVAPWSVTFAIGGMETSLLVALAMGTFYLHLSKQPAKAAFLAALAVLTRPDSLLFVFPLGLHRCIQILRSRKLRSFALRELTPELLAFGLPVGAWLLIGTATYRSPIPHSIFAKAVAYRLPPEAGLVRLLQHYGTPFLGHEILGNMWIGIGLVLYFALYLLGFQMAMRSQRGAWAVMVYPWVYFAAFAIANPLLFRWYLTPPLPLYFLGIFLGIERLSTDLRSRLLTPIAAVAALALALNAWTLHPDHGPTRPAPRMAFIQLELLYQQAASRLQDQLQPGQVLAAADIGALGYFTQARLLDLLGLVSPEATGYYPIPEQLYIINYAIPPDLVADLRPDYLVTLEVYARNGLLLSEQFANGYELIDELPTELYGSRGMQIYRRAQAP